MTADRGALDFDAYVASHGSGLERYAYVLTGHPASAEDLVQTALMKATGAGGASPGWSSPTLMCGAWSPTPFLTCNRHHSNAEWPLADTPDSPGGPDPAVEVVNRDQIARALTSLSAHQRAVIVLRHYLGLSNADIAAELGCSESTVRSHASRALQRMRDSLTSVDLQEKLR